MFLSTKRKKVKKKFGKKIKKGYLCNCYPEYNLFTLKKLIPIEDLERSTCEGLPLFLYIYPTKPPRRGGCLSCLLVASIMTRDP